MYLQGANATLATDAAERLLIEASPLDVLMLQYREGRADIAAAGLGEDLQEVQDRSRESLKKAAKALAWLNITPEMLGA